MNLFIREWQPSNAPRGVFLLLHGMESHSAWFNEFASLLSRNNYAAVAFDRPGCGRSPGPRGHLGSYRDLLAQIASVRDAAEKKYGAVHLAGMSWGGLAALYVGLRKPWLFSSLALLAPGVVTRRDVSFADKLRAAGAFFSHNVSRPLAVPFRPEDFTDNPERRRYIADDPDKGAVVTAGFCLETLKMRRFVEETAGKRRLPPTLCLLAGSDAIVDNAATRRIAARAGATVETVPDSAHAILFDNPEAAANRMIRHADAAAQAAPSGNVWVLGALAALLSHGRQNAAVLVKPAYAGRFREEGITLSSGAARRTARRLAVAADPGELPENPDLVVVAVKSFDTPALLESVGPHVPDSAVVASVQNGLGNEGAIAAAFPRNTVVAASVCAGLEMIAPGNISWPDDRGGLAAALYRGDAELARSVWLDRMIPTGMESVWIAGENAGSRLKWSKLMLNIAFNALNSATGLSVRETLRHSEHSVLALTALREGFAVMKGLGVDPVDLPGCPVRKLRFLLKFPLPIVRRLLAWRAGREPEAAFSMRQDILKNRGVTEINELNGKIVEIGLSLGRSVSANKKLVSLLEKEKDLFCINNSR